MGYGDIIAGCPGIAVEEAYLVRLLGAGRACTGCPHSTIGTTAIGTPFRLVDDKHLYLDAVGGGLAGLEEA